MYLPMYDAFYTANSIEVKVNIGEPVNNVDNSVLVAVHECLVFAIDVHTN